MQNKGLVADHIKRASNRLKAIETLHQLKSWADVVRESQEVVELALKALLRASNIEVPRIHDVSEILSAQKKLLPKSVMAHVERLAQISKELRRDRELAFYGADDLTPSDFYTEADAKKAKHDAAWVVETVQQGVKIK